MVRHWAVTDSKVTCLRFVPPLPRYTAASQRAGGWWGGGGGGGDSNCTSLFYPTVNAEAGEPMWPSGKALGW